MFAGIALFLVGAAWGAIVLHGLTEPCPDDLDDAGCRLPDGDGFHAPVPFHSNGDTA